MTKQTSAYGNWPSTITSQILTQGINRLSEPKLDRNNRYWLESRPEEKGRTAVVRQTPDGKRQDITPDDVNVRTRIHEYGGGSYHIHGGTVYFINNDDQRIYCIKTIQAEHHPVPLTPEGNYRYSDMCIDDKRNQLICVCEIHKDNKEPENCIIAVKLDGSSTTAFNVLVFGNDFYSNPRVSNDGNYLSWLTWKHPYMPWDNSECWLAEMTSLGLLQKHRKVAGGVEDGSRNESIFQPQWSPTDELFFVSDRNEWWNIYRYDPSSKSTECILEKDAEFATPQWVFGMSTYHFLNSFTIFCTYTENGRWKAATIDTMTGNFTALELPYSSFEGIYCNDETDTAIFIANNDTELDTIITWKNHKHQIIANSGQLAIDKEEFSTPQAKTFKNKYGHDVHGFYYPPHNSAHQATEDELPPLLVMCHGGPTGATRSALNLKIQYWTNRGFAVFDINYSGSTGYGRSYRNRLKEQWGILDVEDICAGAAYLIDAGLADPERTAVRGSSAGGYSVLAALTFQDQFKAGASLYGIGDLNLLAEDTHKFESRYMDSLVGPYPDAKDIYEARSPLLHVDKLSCPVIFLQGLEDKVVPPNQAEAMVAALIEKNIPTAYVTFEEEGHGFRQAKNIQHALETELAFYANLFQLNPTEKLPDVPFMTPETLLELSTEKEAL
jgi:dipeptidyl aminopeptidase/acylaminoacyl peptidase